MLYVSVHDVCVPVRVLVYDCVCCVACFCCDLFVCLCVLACVLYVYKLVHVACL